MEPATIHLGEEASPFTVRDWAELRTLLDDERSKWGWLAPGGEGEVANVASNIQSHWNTLLQNLSEFQNQNLPLTNANQLAASFNNGPLLFSESTMGRMVLDILERNGTVAAAAAYAFLKGHLNLQYVNSRQMLLGVLLTALPDMNDAAAVEASLKSERQRFSSNLRNQSARLDDEFAKREADFEKLVERGKQLGVATLRAGKTKFTETVEEWKKGAEETEQGFLNTKAAYEEYMSLQAPSDYWKNKAAEHSSAATVAGTLLRNYLIGFTVAMLACFTAAACFVYYHPLTETVAGVKKETPVELYILISAGLAILSTVGFWVGRMFSKLYFSEHHLKTDAEERAIMAKTYLALIKVNAANETDKPIVLSALFRSTADGIVKDEGPPSFTLQGAAGKLLGP